MIMHLPVTATIQRAAKTKTFIVAANYSKQNGVEHDHGDIYTTKDEGDRKGKIKYSYPFPYYINEKLK